LQNQIKPLLDDTLSLVKNNDLNVDSLL